MRVVIGFKPVRVSGLGQQVGFARDGWWDLWRKTRRTIWRRLTSLDKSQTITTARDLLFSLDTYYSQHISFVTKATRYYHYSHSHTSSLLRLIGSETLIIFS